MEFYPSASNVWGCYLELETCMRSDTVLFNFYSSLLAQGSRFDLSLDAVLAEGQKLFTYSGEVRQFLVVSHQRRVLLNRMCNDRDRQTKKDLSCI